jgi:GNAT superfamily N-acetyltransferase
MTETLPVEFRITTVDEILPLRHAILRAGRPIETARFAGDDDPRSLHLAGISGRRMIACLTFLPHPLDDRPAWQLRGMAVGDQFQGQGIGGRLLAHAEQLLRQPSGAKILCWCNARVTAARFYESHGWQRLGEAFDIPEVGAHIRMSKILRPPAES